MAPSSPPLSDGRNIGSGGGGEHRRVRRTPGASSAIAAAEAAASYILSDGPIVSPITGRAKRLVRNRSGSSGSGSANGGVNASSSGGGNGPDNAGRVSSFLFRIQNQRAWTAQRREGVVTACWAALFALVGAIFLYEGEHLRRRDPRGTAAGTGNRLADVVDGTSAKGTVGVPLPPSVERRLAAGDARAFEVATTANGARRHHAIPPVLVFTYHTDLLAAPESELKDDEDVALAKNVKRIVALHPESAVRFLDDDQCLESIKVALGPNTNLTRYFNEEQRGMYKADICRGAALYETGGLYFDIDIEPRMPLWDAIAPKTEFVTTLVHKDSNHHGGFFQAFIGVTKKHEMMKRYLELFVKYYQGEVKVNGPLGVYFLRMAYDELKKDGTLDEDSVELWQEVRYRPETFPDVHRGHWGLRRACQMLVVAPPIESRKGERGDPFERKERTVPLFSHANGSRMCGGKDTRKKG